MKTLTLETSKRLALYLEKIETDLHWIKDSKGYFADRLGHDKGLPSREGEPFYICKTLTLEEALEFIPGTLPYITGETMYLEIYKDGVWGKKNPYEVGYWTKARINNGEIMYTMSYREYGKTLIEAVEKMIIYLLDKDLLKEG